MLTGEALEEYRELCDRCETKDGKRMPGTTNADWRRLNVLRNQLLDDEQEGAAGPVPEPTATDPGEEALEEIDEETLIQKTSGGAVIPWKIGSPVPEGYKTAVVNVGDRRVGRAYKEPAEKKAHKKPE